MPYGYGCLRRSTSLVLIF
ncbi:hypothetical protein LINPERHAP2_LOCUS3509 [Linum perenne]